MLTAATIERRATPAPRATSGMADLKRIEAMLDELIDDARGAYPGTPEAAMVRASRAGLLLEIDKVIREARTRG